MHEQGVIPYLREKGPTTEYRPTPHFGLNFLLRSKVYSNMHLYVSAMERTCATTIKWAWLRLLAVQGHSLRLKRGKKWIRLGSTTGWQVIFWLYLDYLKCSSYKSAIWVTVAVNSMIKYRPDKSRPPSISNRTWARLKSIVTAATIQIMTIA